MDNDLDKETRLGMLASAILDGSPIDWPAAKSTGDAVDQDVVRQLEIVAEIAALHRNLDPTRSSDPSALQALDETRPAIAWGHLRLLEPVGRGTFGEVYRAWDTHLDREVALKLLRTGPVTDDPSASLSDPARVVNEGRLLAKVRHPNVITVYGAEPRDGRVGIWMEFIQRQDASSNRRAARRVRCARDRNRRQRSLPRAGRGASSRIAASRHDGAQCHA